MSQQVKKPLTCLQQKVNKNITVKLKNDIEYRGKMSNVGKQLVDGKGMERIFDSIPGEMIYA